LLAELCIRHDVLMLANDNDFLNIAQHCPLRVWTI
jgi:hypothetical protein